MKRYPEYKESGVGWIGEIPSYWQSATIKHLTKNLDGKRIPLSGEVRADQKRIYPYYGANGVIDYVEDYIFEGEHILIGEDGAPFFDKTREVSLLASGKFWVNNHCHILKNMGTSEVRFIVHCLNSVDYFEYITGSTRDKLTQADLNRIKIPIPTYQEQTQIASFLDRKTGQIDELIRIKARRIELLQEQRTALINQAVTKGLDPNVEMKPSGVEWIGKIPAHWEVTQIKQIALFVGGYSEFGSESYTDGGIPIFRIGDVTQFIKIEQVKRVPTQQVKRLKQNQVCHGDTLIVMIGRRAGESTYYAFDYPSILSAQVAGLRATKADSKFLFYFIHSASFLNTITPLFFGATRDNISKTALMRVKIPFPPDREQTQVADFLDHKAKQIDELMAAEGRKIEHLKEYCQSLISEAVTGKIDVRNEM